MNKLDKYTWQAFGEKNFEKHVRNGFDSSKGFCFPRDALEWYVQTVKLLKKSDMNDHINSKDRMNYIINLYNLYINDYSQDIFLEDQH
jgi:hypothetical protein